MQLSPNLWGPFFWHTMHISALGYPETPSYLDKKAAKDFFESLQFLLPCNICREHYSRHLREYPLTPYLDNRADLFKWTVLMHNIVNKSLNKISWTESEIIEYYKRLGKRDRSPIWMKEDMQEIDISSFLRGVIAGSIGLSLLSGSIYIIHKYKLLS